MPYIEKALRAPIDEHVDKLTLNSPGELNYAITKLIMGYTKNRVRYSTINDVVGAIECAKAEFYRIVVAPYEDLKIVQNGKITV